MALELKISVEENCDSLYLYDRTGRYDEKCNPTGWGLPNEQLSNATSAEFKVYPPKMDQPIVFNVFPDFPDDRNHGYELLPEDINVEKFESGIWRFDYCVVVSGKLYVVSCQKLLVKDVSCCLGEKKIDIDVDNFESDEDEV